MHSLFSTLIGNLKAKEILRRMVDHHTLPTVVLLHGPAGVGKGLFAEEIARAIVKNVKTHHPDIHTLHPDLKSGQHPIATIRQLLEEAALPPFEAPAKLFIIHDADKMLATSSNALLKTLEEPPPNTYFILLTADIDHLLPTIVSRCNKVPFYPIPDDELAQFLTEKHHVKEAKKLAILSQGSVGEALERLARPIDFHLDDLLRATTYTDIHKQLAHFEEFPEATFHQDADRLFEEILYWIRTHDPLRLEQALPRIHEARQALHHHIKLKNILEQFCLLTRSSNR